LLNGELGLLRTEIAYIVLGTLFLFFGLAALTIAAIRERRETRILIWLGIWSVIYGINLLIRSPALVAALPHALQLGVPAAKSAAGFLFLVMGLLVLSELTVGKLSRFTQAMAVASGALAVVGITLLLVNGPAGPFQRLSNLLAIIAAAVLIPVFCLPKLSARFMAYPSRILTAGALVFAMDVLDRNLSGVLHLPAPSSRLWDELAFAGFLLSFAYVAARKVFASEKRLFSLENELDVARKIQSSILPTSVPEMNDLRIAAAYQPAAAVGGDFYEFIRVDANRVGFLIADVAGHGIPAALIASMIKIGVQSIVPCASDPGEVLRTLNSILSGQPRGLLVSAAYLWVDTEARTARYSAAGHPPLLRWRGPEMEGIESNGLLMGVLKDTEFPVHEMTLQPGDRFLLCTDGVTEAENAAGVAFGDQKLGQVVVEHQGRSCSELSGQLLLEIPRWQPASMAQQDDITFILVDVV
jgi:phosphoserine phosphatase RsbU/P